MYFIAVTIEVEVTNQRSKVVTFQVPDFNTTIICNTGKDRRGFGTPTDVVDLLLKGVFVVFTTSFVSANQLLCGRASLSFPNSDSPIVGAGEEDRVLFIVPERIAANLVDGSSVTMEHFHPLFRVRGLALQNSAVLSSCKVVDALTIIREIDGKTSGVDETHGSCLFIDIGAGVYIGMV